MTEIEQIQTIVYDWFDTYDDATVTAFISSFIYMQPAKNENISSLIDKFLDDNGLKNAYVNNLSDSRRNANGENVYFNSCSRSDKNMLIDIQSSLLSLAFNRLYRLINSNTVKEISYVEKIVEKPRSNKNFNFMKNELLDVYFHLNNNECYFYSKEDDLKLVNKIKKLKNE